MANHTRIMLYVNDVPAIANFWITAFQAIPVEQNDLPDGYSNIVLAVDDGTELSLFPEDFIQQYSPEVLGTVGPSLLFFRHDFDQLHDQLPDAGDVVDNDGTLTFNFTDPEGNYFAVAKIEA